MAGWLPFDDRIVVIPDDKRITAHGRDALLSALSSIDISVPPRGKERTTAHTETWSICRLVSTLAAENKLDYPFAWQKNERPDYVFQIGARNVGIEITEAVKEDLVRAEVLPQAKSNSLIDISLFKWEDTRKTLPELRDIASRTKLSGPGWAGDEAEAEFAVAVKDIINRKSAKLNQDTFQKFDENWLLIYENLNLIGMNLKIGIDYLFNSLENYWGSNAFDRIFIETPKFLIELTTENIAKYNIYDMWNNSGT